MRQINRVVINYLAQCWALTLKVGHKGLIPLIILFPDRKFYVKANKLNSSPI